MPKFRAKVCNCLIGGEGRDPGWSDEWATGLQLRLGGHRVDIRQRRGAFGPAAQELKGLTAHTTDIVIEGIQKAARGLRIATDLCSLLGFATMSQVRVLSWRWGDQGEGFNQQAITLRFRWPIETNDGAAVRQFLEQTWRAYSRLKTRRKLPAVFGYLTTAELPQQPIEASLLLAFVALESLKTTYAQAAGIPFRKNYFRKGNTKATYSFQELLALMLREVGMKPGLKRIVRLRNEIVHSGLARRGFDSQWAMYENCQDLVREYLLRLLEYTGEYVTYGNMEYENLRQKS